MSERPITFFVNGTPKSWKAPHFNRMTGTAYQGKPEKVWQQSIWGQAMPYAPEKPFTGPLCVHLTFCFTPPASWPEWRRSWVVENQALMPNKPDIVNLRKAVEDALEGPFWVDDKLVCTGNTEKRYADTPGVRVEITPLLPLPQKKSDLKEPPQEMRKEASDQA